MTELNTCLSTTPASWKQQLNDFIPNLPPPLIAMPLFMGFLAMPDIMWMGTRTVWLKSSEPNKPYFITLIFYPDFYTMICRTVLNTRFWQNPAAQQVTSRGMRLTNIGYFWNTYTVKARPSDITPLMMRNCLVLLVLQMSCPFNAQSIFFTLTFIMPVYLGAFDANNLRAEQKLVENMPILLISLIMRQILSNKINTHLSRHKLKKYRSLSPFCPLIKWGNKAI